MAHTFININSIQDPSYKIPNQTRWVVPAILKGDEARTFDDVWEALDWAEFRCEMYNDSMPHRKHARINSAAYTAKHALVQVGEKAQKRMKLESSTNMLNVYNIRRADLPGKNPMYFGTVFNAGDYSSVNLNTRNGTFNPVTANESQWVNGETLKLKELFRVPKNRFKYPDAFKAAQVPEAFDTKSIEGLAERIRRDWATLGLNGTIDMERAERRVAERLAQPVPNQTPRWTAQPYPNLLFEPAEPDMARWIDVADDDSDPNDD